jgi:hypothetical protein
MNVAGKSKKSLHTLLKLVFIKEMVCGRIFFGGSRFFKFAENL